jgi:hypothetical protein
MDKTTKRMHMYENIYDMKYLTNGEFCHLPRLSVDGTNGNGMNGGHCPPTSVQARSLEHPRRVASARTKQWKFTETNFTVRGHGRDLPGRPSYSGIHVLLYEFAQDPLHRNHPNGTPHHNNTPPATNQHSSS